MLNLLQYQRLPPDWISRLLVVLGALSDLSVPPTTLQNLLRWHGRIDRVATDLRGPSQEASQGKSRQKCKKKQTTMPAQKKCTKMQKMQKKTQTTCKKHATQNNGFLEIYYIFAFPLYFLCIFSAFWRALSFAFFFAFFLHFLVVSLLLCIEVCIFWWNRCWFAFFLHFPWETPWEGPWEGTFTGPWKPIEEAAHPPAAPQRNVLEALGRYDPVCGMCIVAVYGANCRTLMQTSCRDKMQL